MSTSRITRVAIWITAAWAMVCAIYIGAKLVAATAGEATIWTVILRWPLADFGQFVGGAVGVPAFAWVALTFFIQRDALATSLGALAIQTQGLRDQTDLLRHDLHLRAAPRFRAEIIANEIPAHGEPGFRTCLRVTNEGEEIHDVEFYLDTFTGQEEPVQQVLRRRGMPHLDSAIIYYPQELRMPGLLTVRYALVDGHRDQLQFAFIRAELGSPVVRWTR